MDFAADLHAHDEKEQHHQAVVHDPGERSLEAGRSHVEADGRLPEPQVAIGPRRVCPTEGDHRRGDQEDPAGGVDAKKAVQRAAGEPGEALERIPRAARRRWTRARWLDDRHGFPCQWALAGMAARPSCVLRRDATHPSLRLTATASHLGWSGSRGLPRGGSATSGSIFCKHVARPAVSTAIPRRRSPSTLPGPEQPRSLRPLSCNHHPPRRPGARLRQSPRSTRP